MQPPQQVRDIARTADLSGFTPIVAALNLEIIEQEVTPASLSTISAVLSDTQTSIEVFGGEPGSVWAAYQLPLLNPEGSIAEWAVKIIGGNHSMQAAEGTLRPPVLKDWDEAMDTILARLHNRIHDLVLASVQRVARHAGMAVMAWAKDPTIKSKLAASVLSDVPHVANKIETRTGTAWIAAHVDLATLIDRETQRLKSDIDKLVQETQTDIEEANLLLFGASVINGVDWAVISLGALDLFRQTALLSANRKPPNSLHGGITLLIVSAASTSIRDAILRPTIPQISADTAPPRALSLRDSISSGTLTIVTEQTWVHGMHGFSRNPYPPHLALNGVLVGSSEWTNNAFSQQSEGKMVESFSANGWYPGDHVGCRCGFRQRVILRTFI